MPHDHHGHHSHIDPQAGDAKLAWAVAVNLGLTVAQVVGGILSGSLALIADALHNFSDAIALIIAVFARRIARRPADTGMNFGYDRAEAVAALVNYTTLTVLALYLVYEGVLRFIAPEPIDGWMVVWIAGLALAVDLVTAALTLRMSRTSMNIRAAFLHNLADALGSVAVIVAGVVVILWGWVWVDPVVTLMVAIYILWHVWSEAGGVIRHLMLGSPPDMEAGKVARAIVAVEDVQDVHLMRLWSVREHEPALEAHLVIAAGAWAHADRVKARVKVMLSEKFEIHHSTLEMECALHSCNEAPLIGG